MAMDELDFRRRADSAMDALKKSLITAEDDATFEVEDQSGALHISFDDPPGRFVISPNALARQIWISALSTSFKLDWSDRDSDFVLEKSGERLKQLVNRLVNQQLGEGTVVLA
jgi:CyaY protein